MGVGIIPPYFHPDEIVDGYGCVLMPAFFNAHTHAAMTLERGWAEDLAFEDWLNKKIWVAESALEEEDIYWGASLAAVEMIQSGIVGFADHYFWMDQVARVVSDCGMKALLAWCHFGNGVDQELGKKSFEDTISLLSDGRTVQADELRHPWDPIPRIWTRLMYYKNLPVRHCGWELGLIFT
jgi:5-methylthioadenosine/S-adenosylhomocysteine deaminase